jgi:hypothetical protein
MLAPGVLVNFPPLLPIILTGLSIWLLFALVKTAYNRTTGVISAFLAFMSPSTLILGGSLFSEAISRFYLTLFLFALIKTFKNKKWYYPFIAGFALGYAFNTRPLTALVFGMCGAVFAVYGAALSPHCLMSRTRKKTFLCLLPLMAMLCITLLWNRRLTGNLFHPPFKNTMCWDSA